jgi:hypothetical protein
MDQRIHCHWRTVRVSKSFPISKFEQAEPNYSSLWTYRQTFHQIPKMIEETHAQCCEFLFQVLESFTFV